jgi:outer membrane protein
MACVCNRRLQNGLARRAELTNRWSNEPLNMTSLPRFCPHRRPPPTRSIAVLALFLTVGVAQAADRADPLGTARLRPSAPSQFWDGTASVCPAAPAVPDPVRLADAVDLALCNNPLTRESWANAKASAAALGIARSAYLPNLTGSATVERSRTWNSPASGNQTLLDATLTFDYLLFDFGGRDAAVDLARESLLAADWAHNNTLQTVLLASVQSYYQVYATAEAVQAAAASEKASLTSLEATRARLRVGNATRADVLQAQTAYSQAQLTRTQREGDAANARGVLANQLGLSADRELRIAPPPDLQTQRVAERAVGELIDLAKSRRPDLAAAQAQVRAAESNIRVQQALGKPSLSLIGTAGATHTVPGADPRSGAIGLQLTIPFFTGYRNTYQILQARELLDLQQATRDKLATDVALDVWTAYQDLRTQGQALTTATELVASAQESYNVALARYRAGVGAITDLLNAQSALASAQLQVIQARFSWNVAKATLAKAIGLLEPDLIKEAPAAPAAPPQ